MNAPFELLRLDHLVLRTNDVDRLVTFYQSLGCVIERRVESMDMTQLRAGASMIDIVGSPERDPAAPGRNLDHFAIRIEPFDEKVLHQWCEEQAIEARFHTRLLGADGYGPAVYISDPDGNRVELKGPPLEEDEPGGES